jgi:hypothetical protein
MTLEERLKQFAELVKIADQPCAHPEKAKGNDPFCFECHSCQAGVLLIRMAQLLRECAGK